MGKRGVKKLEMVVMDAANVACVMKMREIVARFSQ